MKSSATLFTDIYFLTTMNTLIPNKSIFLTEGLTTVLAFKGFLPSMHSPTTQRGFKNRLCQVPPLMEPHPSVDSLFSAVGAGPKSLAILFAYTGSLPTVDPLVMYKLELNLKASPHSSH